jgi:hypothetical protein
MRARALIVLTIISAVVTATCGTHVPESKDVAPGTPYVSWVFMSGDRDNPDREFVCQSDRRTPCVLDASRPDAQAFSDVHFYYHAAGMETKYGGTIEIGFFEGSPSSRRTPTSVVVKKNESITNQSVTGIVTSKPGTYAVTFALTATVSDTGKNQEIRHSVDVVVK